MNKSLKSDLLFFVYRGLTTVLSLPVSPAARFLRRRKKMSQEELDQRLGKYPSGLRPKKGLRPVVWIHAASVGEVNAASSIIHELLAGRPNIQVIVSTTTRTGRETARSLLAPGIPCVFAPLDFPDAVRRALRFFRPNALVCIETEIWPNWFYEAFHQRIPTAIINGRISARSIQTYRKAGPLFQKVLQNVSAFSMIRPEDADRIRQIGAPSKRVRINGNAKYDRLAMLSATDLRQNASGLFQMNQEDRIVVAGSTRTGEEEMILDALERVNRKSPGTKWIIAPRHIERTADIEQLLHRRKHPFRLRTTLPKGHALPDILILDTIGELQTIYSFATAAFCGGSLVPKGGHNILEPAVVGTPVFYGPFMDDFSDARELLEKKGGGGVVHDAAALADAILDLFQNPRKLSRMRKMAAQAVQENRGAAQKHAAVVLSLLADRP